MIYRTFFCFLFIAGAVGCRSTGSGVLKTALGDGPSGLARACSNGVAAACAISGRAARPIHPVSILQGLTANDRARFSVVMPLDSQPRYFVRDGDVARELTFARARGPGSDFGVDRVDANGLRPDVDFELIVVDARNGDLWDRRTFRALDVDRGHARLAVISGTDDRRLNEARLMWPGVFAQNVDAVILLGDNVYVDHDRDAWIRPDPPALWRRYVETRRELPPYFAPRLVPTLATWDDHDFAYGNSDSTYPYREQSRDTFLKFFAQDQAGENFERGPGVSSWWRVFGVEIGLTDNRSFRSVNRAAAPQTHFGAEQENWLVERMSQARAPVLLASGDQFFGGYHTFESYEGNHPESFRTALAAWRRAPTPIVFMSGDRHLSEVIDVPVEHLGYPTYEITSSGLHATMFADAFKTHPSPRQLAGVAGQLNYSVIEIMRAEPHLVRLSVQSFGPRQKLFYQRTLTVKR